MFQFDGLWSWLIRAAVLSSLILLVGGLALKCIRQPADRLRVIQWSLIACLVAPCLPVSTVWHIVSVNLVRSAQVPAEPALLHSGRNLGQLAPSPTSADTSPKHAPAHTPSSHAIDTGSAPLMMNPGEPPAKSELPAMRAQLTPDPHSLGAREIIVGAWALAISVLILWTLAGIWIRFSLQRRGRAPSPALWRLFEQIAGPAGARVRLLISDTLDSPMTWGTLRPLIVVPKKLAANPHNSDLRCGLAHEWSHIKQRDMASLWLVLAAQLVCFYQPLYWVLRRRMLLCQDYIADAFAARYADSAEDYAAFLVRLARSRLQPASSLTLGIADSQSQLSRRVKMLVSSSRVRPNCRRRLSVLSASGAMVGMLLLTTIDLDAREPQARSAGAQKPTEHAAAASAPGPIAATAAATNKAPQKVGVISGALFDAASGKPVAGAHVILRSGNVVTTESDQAGNFRFENVKAYPAGYEIWAYRDNLIADRTGVAQLDGADPAVIKFKPVRLEMKPGKQVRFVIKAKETGRPLSHAAVKFGYPDRRSAVTDDHGEAAVGGLGSEQYDVTVEAAGYARDASQLDLAQGEAVVSRSVSLNPGGEIYGVVVNEQGKPVPKADVVYREPAGIGFYGDSFRTDSEGKFSHRFLPLDVPLEISVSKQNFLSNDQSIALTANQRVKNVRVVLTRRPVGGSVAGVVRDQNGKPLAGAKVANYGNRSSQERHATTDQEGRFALHDLFEGSGGINVLVSAKGFAPERVPVKPAAPQAPAEISVTLKPGHALRGRIVNEAGNPVGGAYVMARSPMYPRGMESVRSDDQGHFTFDSLPSDVRFQISHPDYASSSAMPLELDGSEPVTITLEDPGLIQGQVQDAATKQPLKQFRIRLGFSRGRQPDDATGSYDASWANPGLAFQASDGRFKIEPLVARMPLELTIEADGYERKVIPRAVAYKRASAEPLSIDLAPRTQREPYTLAVQLKSDDGRPLSGVQLRLIVSTNQPKGAGDNAFNWILIDNGQLGDKSYVEQFLPGVTDKQGRYEFKNILPGKYLQLAYWGEGAPKGRSLAFDETRAGESDSIVIDVPRPATVRGTVDRSKFPDAGQVRISGATESFLQFESKLTPDQTAFELRDVPPGEYWISVDTKPQPFTENGHQMYRIAPLASQRIALKPGDEATVRFDTPDPPR